MDSPVTIQDPEMKPAATGEPDIIVLKFADSKIPVFKEVKNKDWILYGADNRYPEYLTYLYDKSGKHNAILTGKANYVYGEGYENGDMIMNRCRDTLNDMSQRSILDTEVYGGFHLEIIWGYDRKIAEIYHVDFTTLRKAKNGLGWYWKETWDPLDRRSKEDPEFIPSFNPQAPYGSQIYTYSEYRPMVRFYPLPSYIGCNNYIETDIEISKYYLSAIRNGMMPSKMIQFYQGDPSEDKKKDIERRFAKKFAGAENAGRFILVFNNSKDKTVDISDLSATELDKQFEQLNQTCQQEIFSGHLVTSPALFGVKTEGQLGTTTELYTAYAIFQNTYSKPKAHKFDREINLIMSYSRFPGLYALRPTDPIGVQFDVKDVINSLPKAFVFQKLSIPREMWDLENIGADNRPTPTTPIPPARQVDPPGIPDVSASINDAIRNLSAKQHQQLLRIMRQYTKGQLTEPAARTLIRAGTGLADSDIDSLLGITSTAPGAMSADDDDIETAIAVYDSYGDNRDDFEIIKSKRVIFSTDEEAAEDEREFIAAAFAEYDVTLTEDKILELIRKDKRITPEVIADTIGQSVSYVQNKINDLVRRGYLDQDTAMDGDDEIIERTVPEDTAVSAPPPTAGSIPPTQIFVKYSYDVKPNVGPSIIKTSRPFCKRMVALNRIYSRADIEKISGRLGYSVWDRKGGWWGKNPECRHRWVSHVVVKKGGKS